MKTEIKHSCGCTETVNIIGPIKDRDAKIEYLESIPCRECEVKARAATNGTDGLPALEGSEKQIAWAITLRAKKYEAMQARAKSILAHAHASIKTSVATGQMTQEQGEQNKEKFAAIIDEIVAYVIAESFAETSAKVWIDNRDEIPTDWEKEFARVGKLDAIKSNK